MMHQQTSSLYDTLISQSRKMRQESLSSKNIYNKLGLAENEGIKKAYIWMAKISQEVQQLIHLVEEQYAQPHLYQRLNQLTTHRKVCLEQEQALAHLLCRCGQCGRQRGVPPAGHTPFSWGAAPPPPPPPRSPGQRGGEGGHPAEEEEEACAARPPPGERRRTFPPQSHTLFSWTGMVFEVTLGRTNKNSGVHWPQLIKRLRTQEESEAFQRKLARSKRVFSAQTDYTEENFTFGTTMLQGWYKLSKYGCIEDVLKQPGSQYIVFGSSSGLLAFFGSMLWDIETTGYEILPCLHEVAQKAVDAFSVEQVYFRCGDALTAPLPPPQPRSPRPAPADRPGGEEEEVGKRRRCKGDPKGGGGDSCGGGGGGKGGGGGGGSGGGGRCVLVLASLAWDRGLSRALARRAAADLRPGSVIIDYIDRTNDEEFMLKCSLRGDETIPTSWSSEQKIYVYLVI